MWTLGGRGRWWLVVQRRQVWLTLAAVVLVVAPLAAAAAHFSTIEERQSWREARHTTDAAGCRCTASLRLSGQPDLQWRGSQLTWVPRVDVQIRTRGASGGPDWSVGLNHEGSTSFTSDDVTAPGEVSFSGSQNVASGACGDNRYVFRGMALPAVVMNGVTRGLVGERERLNGTVRMRASLIGCGEDAEARQFGFSVRELGNLRVGGWRIWR
ncbi:MAG: hypothetical protein HY372_04140 [Candidatus Andersenbacteria bacterium]|nr:hypothetical protein [Candidatus Andersenbacteria bacterium]